MTLTQLQYVLAVNKTRHFSAAAEICFVTQPTLSMQIQKLEQQLGVTIFDRSKSPVKPTKIGERIIEQAGAVLTEANLIDEIISDERGLIEGELRIGIIPTICPYLTPIFLTSFCRKYPNVQLSIEEMPTATCLKKLEDEDIDIAVLATAEDDKYYIQQQIYEEELYLFVNNRHKLYKKDRIKVTDLQAEDIWLLEEGHCLRDKIMDICRIRRVQDIRPGNLIFKVGTLESLIHIVQDSFGYTLLPHLTIGRLSANQRKCVRKFSSNPPSRKVNITRRRKHLKRSLIEAFTNEVLATVSPLFEASFTTINHGQPSLNNLDATTTQTVRPR